MLKLGVPDMANTVSDSGEKHPRVFTGGARPTMQRPPQGLDHPTRVEDMLAEMERFKQRARRSLAAR